MSQRPDHHPPPVPAGAWGMVKEVARSFAISLQLLPAPVRWPVALAYLLARASDSVADAVGGFTQTSVASDGRLVALDELQEAMHQAVLGAPPSSLPHVQALLPHIPMVERRLLVTLPTWLDALHRLPMADRQLIGAVCDHIFAGQRLDLQRFAVAHAGVGTVQSLANLEELEDYTYKVAGCVGPFWTHICEAHLPGWRRADLDQMLSASLAYGQALQLLNILRDTSEDLMLGRCYWPRTDLDQLEIGPQQWATAVRSKDVATLQRLRPLMVAQGQRIRVGLSLGLAYSASIGPWRLRAATALPALIGLRTLQDIEVAGAQAWLQPVKVRRRVVHHLMWQCVWTGLTPSSIKRLGLQLGASEDHLNLPALDGTMAP